MSAHEPTPGVGSSAAADLDADARSAQQKIETDHADLGAEVWEAAQNLVALSKWIDAGNANRDPEAVTWGRLSKIAEEHGEVIAAYIGYTGQNPRKGVTHFRHQVIEELLDVAVTALGAVEHMSAHQGLAIAVLAEHINGVAKRAGVVSPPVSSAPETCDHCGATLPHGGTSWKESWGCRRAEERPLPPGGQR